MVIEQRTITTVERPVGREDELAALGEMLDAVAAATSQVTVLSGEAGLGKSSLVDWTIREARQRGFTVLRATGVEFEQGLAFSGLSAVVRPLLDRLATLDPSQARALQGALGLVDADGRLLAVHGATLALVSAAAEDTPVLVAVDDAQWVDQSSLESLVFAAHRCEADRVGFLFVQRTGLPCLLDRTELDRVGLGGLAREAAVELLGHTGVAAPVAERCWELTRGNPLALVEAGRRLSDGQRTGDEPLPAALPIGERLLDSFRAQMADLPPATLLALAVTAFQTDGHAGRVAAALARVGGRLDDLYPAETAGVVSLADGRVEWRHPLLRAGVLHLVDGGERRRLHRALAEAASEAGDPERALWHLSESVIGPDEAVSARMAELGEAALHRRSLTAAFEAYEQAARLTTDVHTRNRHLTAAAMAAFTAGDHLRAQQALAPVVEEVTDPTSRAVMAAVLGQAELWLRGPKEATPRFEMSARAVRS